MQSPSGTGRLDGEEAGTAETPATWDYVALGDSLAAGVGARQGYVERYADHLRAETGARVRVLNLGQPGQTSPELLRALRTDPFTRRALGRAEVVTFNIGINDLGRARESYEEGTCGGPQNEGCLRAAVEEVGKNWEAITREIRGLRSGREVLVLTPGLGYTPRTGALLAPYLEEANRRIAATADAEGIPHAEVRLGAEGMGPDGVHPNDRGYGVIAERLRGLGYEPLGAR
jgi:lysophospholipase L1-like esterase